MTSDVGHRSHDSGSGSSDTSVSLVTSQFGLVVKGRTMATAIANRRVGDDRCEERDHQRKYQISSEYGGTLRLIVERLPTQPPTRIVEFRGPAGN
jgi:hypothetical protein